MVKQNNTVPEAPVYGQAMFTGAVCLSKRIFYIKMKERRIDVLPRSSWVVYFRSNKKCRID